MSSSNEFAPELYYRDKSLLSSRVAYEGFFGLKENPFSLTPDPRYLYRTRHAHETLRQLTRGILSRRGLILLTGDVGTGKTTLLNTALHVLRDNPEIGEKTRTAVLVHPTLTPEELFEAVLHDFKVPCIETQRQRRLQCLYEMLLAVRRKGGVAVLVLDEAQLLKSELLDEIGVLLSLRSESEELLQVVLCGHPEIEEKIGLSALGRLSPANVIRCSTMPLTVADTHDYIDHRLKVAGAQVESMFTRDAAAAIHRHSHGIPRVVNLLCAHALSAAGIRGVRHITAQMVDEAAARMPFPDGKLPGRRGRGQHPENSGSPRPPVPPSSGSSGTGSGSSGAGEERERVAAAAAGASSSASAPGMVSVSPGASRAFANASKPAGGARPFRPSPFRAKSTSRVSAGGPRIQAPPQASTPVASRALPVPVAAARVGDRVHHWWQTEFARKRDWMLLCYMSVVGALFLMLAQSVGSADRMRHAVRSTLGFSGLLLLDIALGLAAYFCIVESRAKTRARDLGKPYWPMYRKIPHFVSLASVWLARVTAKDS